MEIYFNGNNKSRIDSTYIEFLFSKTELDKYITGLVAWQKKINDYLENNPNENTGMTHIHFKDVVGMNDDYLSDIVIYVDLDETRQSGDG